MRLILKSMWSEALHTALRKACDSTQTTIAWNAVHLLDPRAWEHYTAAVAHGVHDPQDAIELRQQVKSASLEWDAWAAGPARTRHSAIIFSCALELFTDEDWRNYVSMLESLNEN